MSTSRIRPTRPSPRIAAPASKSCFLECVAKKFLMTTSCLPMQFIHKQTAGSVAGLDHDDDSIGRVRPPGKVSKVAVPGAGVESCRPRTLTTSPRWTV